MHGGERRQVVAQLAAVGVAVVGPLRERALQDLVDPRGQLGPGVAHERDRRVRVQPGGLDVAVGVERHLAGQRVVEQHAERVHVGARVERLAGRLLGRQVVARAEHAARPA